MEHVLSWNLCWHRCNMLRPGSWVEIGWGAVEGNNVQVYIKQIRMRWKFSVDIEIGTCWYMLRCGICWHTHTHVTLLNLCWHRKMVHVTSPDLCWTTHVTCYVVEFVDTHTLHVTLLNLCWHRKMVHVRSRDMGWHIDMEHVVFKTAAEETWYIDKVIFLFVDRYV